MFNRFKDLFFQFIAFFKIERSQFSVFFFLIFLSFIFWMLIVLSKDYISTIEVEVNFIDLPYDKLLIEDKNYVLQLQVKSSGFSLLMYKFKMFNNIDLPVDQFISTRKGDVWEYFWIGEQSIVEVQNQLPKSMHLLHLQPNKINLFFSQKTNKIVPVILKSNLSYSSMFRQKEVKLTPDHINISGPKTIIDLIESVSTEELHLSNIKSDENGVVLIKKSNHPEISYSQDKLEWELIVEQFTEGHMNIPLNVNGLPRNYEIKLFPDEVSVNYLVSLDDFELLNSSMFKAEVDFVESKKRLTVKLKEHVDFVENIRISPSAVEYIVIKK